MAQATGHRALIVATAAATFPGSDKPAGCWAEELCAPHNAWVAAGYTVDIATPGGRAITWSPDSLKPEAKTQAVHDFFDNEAYMRKTKSPLALENVDVSGYGVVYVPGGHGAMVDLPDNKPLQQLLAKAWSQGAVLAAVCHGPAALVRVTDPATGAPLLRGKRVSAFTNEEEEQSGLAQSVPWLLEDAVKQSGGVLEKTTPWNAHVVRDGRLVTGQNPASSARLAQEVLAALREEAAR